MVRKLSQREKKRGCTESQIKSNQRTEAAYESRNSGKYVGTHFKLVTHAVEFGVYRRGATGPQKFLSGVALCSHFICASERSSKLQFENGFKELLCSHQILTTT